MNLAVIKYNAGNVQSLIFALERLGIAASVTDNPDELITTDKVIFPGVGEASSAMAYLKERNLYALIKELKQPVFGICLGMQLLCKHSSEGDTDCICIFDAGVKRFSFSGEIKVPQIGWNNMSNLGSDLFSGIEENSYCYFVHSYYAEICAHTAASTEYGIKFSSALQKDNFYGVQFHPEKSSGTGEKILKNFLDL